MDASIGMFTLLTAGYCSHIRMYMLANVEAFIDFGTYAYAYACAGEYEAVGCAKHVHAYETCWPVLCIVLMHVCACVEC